MTIWKKETLQSTDSLIFIKYETWDEPEDDNCKTWHTLTDQHGKVHYLDFSPYVHYKSKHIEAFKKCAELLGRVPTGMDDNEGRNLELKDILVLLDKLLLIEELKSGKIF